MTDEAKVRIRQRIQELADGGASEEEIRAQIPSIRQAVIAGASGATWRSPVPPQTPADALALPKLNLRQRQWEGHERPDAELVPGVDFPMAVPLDPERRRRMLDQNNVAGAARSTVEGLAGGATLGLAGPEAILKAAKEKLERQGVSPEGPQPTAQEEFLDALERAEAARQNPGSRLAGELIGGAYGPGAMGAKGVFGAIKPVSRTGRIVASGLGGAVGGAIEGGGRAAIQGKPWEEVAGETLQGAAGGTTLGTGAGLVSEGLQGLSNAVRGGQGAKARELIESHGGKVGPFTSGKGGPFEGPLKGREPTDVEIGKTARESGARVLKRAEEEHAANLKGPLAKKAELDAANQGKVVVNDLYDELQKLRGSERLTDAERGTVDGWIARLKVHEVEAPPVSKTPTPVPGDEEPTAIIPKQTMKQLVEGEAGSGVYAMTPADLNDFRGMLSDMTKPKIPGSVSKKKLKGAFAAAKRLVDKTEYGPVNAEIHAEDNRYERGRNLLDLPPKPKVGRTAPEGVSEEELAKLANALSRNEQNTVTAGTRNAGRYEQFAQEFPSQRQDIELPQVLASKGKLQYRLSPDTTRGGLIERSKGPAGTLAAAGAGYGLAHLLGLDPTIIAALAGGANMARLNAPGIAGRLLYRPAGALGAAGRAAGALTPGAGRAAALYDPIQALLERRRRQQEEQTQ